MLKVNRQWIISLELSLQAVSAVRGPWSFLSLVTTLISVMGLRLVCGRLLCEIAHRQSERGANRWQRASATWWLLAYLGLVRTLILSQLDFAEFALHAGRDASGARGASTLNGSARIEGKRLA